MQLFGPSYRSLKLSQVYRLVLRRRLFHLCVRRRGGLLQLVGKRRNYSCLLEGCRSRNSTLLGDRCSRLGRRRERRRLALRMLRVWV